MDVLLGHFQLSVSRRACLVRSGGKNNICSDFSELYVRQGGEKGRDSNQVGLPDSSSSTEKPSGCPAVLLPAPGLISSLATYAAEHWTCFRSFSFSSWSFLGFWPGRGRGWSKGGRELLPLQPVCQPVSGSSQEVLSLSLSLLGRAREINCSSLFYPYLFPLRPTTTHV